MAKRLDMTRFLAHLLAMLCIVIALFFSLIGLAFVFVGAGFEFFSDWLANERD